MVMAGSRRSGFFFAVMALAILSLVLATVQVWVASFEQSDYRASQRFKGEAMRSILATVSDESLSHFANASAFYATYKMAEYTSDLNNGGFGPMESYRSNNLKTGMVNRSAFELMLLGESEPNAGRQIAYSDDEKSAYTITAWQDKVDAAANAMGFDLEFSDVKGFDYWQIDPWTVGVKFDFDMDVKDLEGTMSQHRTMHAESSFSIAGFLDPSITRNDMARRSVDRGSATEKQVFMLAKYETPSDVAPVLADHEGPEGNGWFFGPVADGSRNASEQYVLVAPYNSSLPGYADQYGAVIVTTQPTIVATTTPAGCTLEKQVNCLNCMRREFGGPCGDTGWEIYDNEVEVPVIVASGQFDLNSITEVAKDEGGYQSSERYVLIDNEYEGRSMKMEGYHRIWDITALRDMAICGFYVKGNGPSFFQRMLAGAPMNNDELGIESFVVGQWAGGAEDQGHDGLSRLDWEFYGSGGGFMPPKIKGMMGCKSKEMCGSDDAAKWGVGHFRLSLDDAAERYGLMDIYCRDGGASPCE